MNKGCYIKLEHNNTTRVGSRREIEKEIKKEKDGWREGGGGERESGAIWFNTVFTFLIHFYSSVGIKERENGERDRERKRDRLKGKNL